MKINESDTTAPILVPSGRARMGSYSTGKWDRRFIELAFHFAGWSYDPSTKVGAVIVDNRNKIIGEGYNGFPKGTPDDPAYYAHRETKLALIVHAEANAILNAKKDLTGMAIYTTLFPCSKCAALIVQAEIANVYYPPIPEENLKRWGADFKISKYILDNAGVKLIEVRN